MDRPSMPGGGAGAVQEFCNVGAGQPEIAGGAFLLELLEDTPAPADQPLEVVDDRLSRVMRSLEAEIGSGPTSAPAAAEDSESTANGLMSDDGGLEDMLSNFDGSPEAEAPLPFEYWEEVPPVAMGNDMGGWYVDGEGIVAGYELTEPCCYTYSEGSAVQQVYSPLCLWE
ncbi:unnamed protein product [Alopecurus aequalis]